MLIPVSYYSGLISWWEYYGSGFILSVKYDGEFVFTNTSHLLMIADNVKNKIQKTFNTNYYLSFCVKKQYYQYYYTFINTCKVLWLLRLCSCK